MKNVSTNDTTTNNVGGNKTLRFFGDTDRDEIDSVSKSTSKR